MNINGARWRRLGSDGQRDGVGRSPRMGGAPTIAHATAHARATSHPIIRSLEPGEDWNWCYVDEVAFLVDGISGKTRIPLEILKKPSALDKRERRMMEAHTTHGAEILVEVDGLRPLTPTVALEHHRGVDGVGYPDLEGAVPHLMSQVVAVADIYEAMTGARSYQEPAMPEQACLVLARLAGTKLNTALVKAFVNAISFFPLGSVVRTDRDEVGVVVRTIPGEPLHPVIALMGVDRQPVDGEIDTSRRLLSGQYERHVVETLRPQEGLDLNQFLRAS